ncbi:MAG: hypothetical protein ACRETQ_03520, partial [Gammaproteobacteria bacterium]
MLAGAMANGVATRLAGEPPAGTAQVLLEPSEAAMQAEANARERAKWPALLPSAPEADVAAWNRWNTQWKAAHPGAPDFAPPEYIAYANAKLEPAASSPYRFEVQYNYDAASGALASVENAQTGFVYWQAEAGSSAVDAFGQLLGWADGNGVSTTTTYDAATSVPLGIETGTSASATAIQQLAYTWDGYGNLTERQD